MRPFPNFVSLNFFFFFCNLLHHHLALQIHPKNKTQRISPKRAKIPAAFFLKELI